MLFLVTDRHGKQGNIEVIGDFEAQKIKQDLMKKLANASLKHWNDWTYKRVDESGNPLYLRLSDTSV